MKKKTEIHVYRNGENIKINNNTGGKWEFKSSRPEHLISALVGLTMAEWFDQECLSSIEFEMTLYVESLQQNL